MRCVWWSERVLQLVAPMRHDEVVEDVTPQYNLPLPLIFAIEDQQPLGRTSHD